MWLPLIEYALTNKLSTSTVRRRIKNKQVEYKLENGKYFIFIDDVVAANFEAGSARPVESFSSSRQIVDFELYFSELKNQYLEHLSSKDSIIKMQEEQIKLLNSHIEDLKTLVRVLEYKLS